MENMVIGVYDSYAQAENALDDLLAAGFAADRIHLGPDGSDEMENDAASSAAESGIAHFVRSILGKEMSPEHDDIYAEAMRRGSCVLTVHATTDSQREQALDTLNRYDPVDVGERSAHWRSEGWNGYRTVQPGDDGVPAVNPRNRRGDFADSAAAATDADYRSHWENIYARTGERYEEYDAAYRYGNNVARSGHYRDHPWEEVEAELRSDWESHHPESDWDKVKDAIRYGAQRAAGR